MKSPLEYPAAPPSNNLEAWRLAVHSGKYPEFRFEDIVAAIQDLGPHTDKVVLHTLAKHLSDCMIKMIRGLVGRNKRNGGDDIIEEVHSQLWAAIMDPSSADGKGLRVAFKPRLRFRVKDELLREAALDTSAPEVVQAADPADDDSPFEVVARFQQQGPASAIPKTIDPLDVDLLLAKIPNEKKRLAFYLHRDGVPFKSTRAGSDSIEQSLGVSERTARAWVKEVQDFLKDKLGDAA